MLAIFILPAPGLPTEMARACNFPVQEFVLLYTPEVKELTTQKLPSQK